jgi:HSP20 family protein
MSALTITRRMPSLWRSFLSNPDEFDRIFGRGFGLPAWAPLADESMTWMPATDLVEANGEYVLTVELPGMTAKDVEIGVEGGVLSVKGEKKTEKEEKKDGERWHIVERSYGAFERSFTLPPSVEADKVKADFENGVLTLHLPKRAESKGRKITIENGTTTKK